MTIRETLAAIRETGCTAKWSPDYREWRVTLPRALEPSEERREAIANYCNDDDEAISAAQHMIAWHERQQALATARAIIACRG